MAQRASSDAAKLICLWWSLLAFVASGFEHSVANMTVFLLGIFTHADFGTLHNLVRNLTYTVPGNVVGGGLVIAVAYYYAASARRRGPGAVPGWLAPASNGTPSTTSSIAGNGGMPEVRGDGALDGVGEKATVAARPARARSAAKSPSTTGNGTRRRATSPPPRGGSAG
jgi:hypothetical protein